MLIFTDSTAQFHREITSKRNCPLLIEFREIPRWIVNIISYSYVFKFIKIFLFIPFAYNFKSNKEAIIPLE